MNGIADHVSRSFAPFWVSRHVAKDGPYMLNVNPASEPNCNSAARRTLWIAVGISPVVVLPAASPGIAGHDRKFPNALRINTMRAP
ncbi:MAG: hypothetical protein WAM99_10780, partial [Xanthobacteraceae bacterium]